MHRAAAIARHLAPDLRTVSTRAAAPALPQRSEYPFFLAIPVRFRDCDRYGHVNNAVTLEFFDTVINTFLVERGGLDLDRDVKIGYAIETHCVFKRPFTFPGTIEAGLRVGKLGNSSVRYEVGLFEPGRDTANSFGHFVHVFVDRTADKPVAIPDKIRAGLEGIVRG